MRWWWHWCVCVFFCFDWRPFHSFSTLIIYTCNVIIALLMYVSAILHWLWCHMSYKYYHKHSILMCLRTKRESMHFKALIYERHSCSFLSSPHSRYHHQPHSTNGITSVQSMWRVECWKQTFYNGMIRGNTRTNINFLIKFRRFYHSFQCDVFRDAWMVVCVVVSTSVCVCGDAGWLFSALIFSIHNFLMLMEGTH